MDCVWQSFLHLSCYALGQMQRRRGWQWSPRLRWPRQLVTPWRTIGSRPTTDWLTQSVGGLDPLRESNAPRAKWLAEATELLLPRPRSWHHTPMRSPQFGRNCARTRLHQQSWDWWCTSLTERCRQMRSGFSYSGEWSLKKNLLEGRACWYRPPEAKRYLVLKELCKSLKEFFCYVSKRLGKKPNYDM